VIDQPGSLLAENGVTGATNGTIASKKASFSFSSEAGATFECKLDSEVFTACNSPDDLSNLPDGPHDFSVRAVDMIGNVDPSAASRAFTVDTTPSVSLTVKVAKKGGKVSVTFSASDPSGPVSFTCRIDKKASQPCTSPRTYSGAKAGRHVVAVSATDSRGNAGSPVAKSVKVKKPKKKKLRR
jgi:large repetitive protein